MTPEFWGGEPVQVIVDEGLRFSKDCHWAFWPDLESGKAMVCLYVDKGANVMKLIGFGDSVSEAFADAAKGLWTNAHLPTHENHATIAHQ